MTDTETVNHLVEAAAARGITLAEFVQDCALAVERYYLVEGRAVVDTNKGVPDLVRAVDGWLCGTVERTDSDRAKLRRELLRYSGVSAQDADGLHLAAVIALIGKKKRAPAVLESWSTIVSHLA